MVLWCGTRVISSSISGAALTVFAVATAIIPLVDYFQTAAMMKANAFDTAARPPKARARRCLCWVHWGRQDVSRFNRSWSAWAAIMVLD